MRPHLSPSFFRNKFLEQNSTRLESGHMIHPMTNSNNEEPFLGGFLELSEESTKDNSSPLSKKHKGRPSGSKSIPKPPMIIMENSIVDMENIVLEIPIGNDVVEAIVGFARRHEASIAVTNGSGLVSNITFLEPDSRVPAFQLDGPFNVLSLAGVYLNPDCFRVPPQLVNDPLCTAFALQLSGSRGQVFGGGIGGKVNTASDIQISASLFKKPKIIRVVTTDGNVQLFEDDDIPTIDDDDTNDGVVDVGET
ncbi:AT-hook motif nuclear-localized protein 28-like [Vicia villosa]|uniref:AT-hook motif nuclear-localized protein 28-like n=1 Tax=Vicia villosa TaxID=3911 RepID=UPI00273C9C2C|nr:AT-hook motif nuclear-localized protein 28-like [Vicia villosa]